MSRKNEWSGIYQSFKSLYPSLVKKVIGYCPYGYMSILVYLPDGVRMVYDDTERKAKIILAN